MLATPAPARGPALTVLLAANVSDAARGAMPPDLWTKFVTAYVGGTAIPFAGSGEPTLADCRKASADYLVVAPFELRPRLPGLANASGRTAARTHLVVTNCVNGAVVVDRNIAIDSDPPADGRDGDIDGPNELLWARSIPAALPRRRLVAILGRTPRPATLASAPQAVAPGRVRDATTRGDAPEFPPHPGARPEGTSASQPAPVAPAPGEPGRSSPVFIAHIIRVTSPIAIVAIRATGLHPGDALRDFARADRSSRVEPIVLTVTQVYDRYLEVVFASDGDHPGIGDLVAPIPDDEIATPR